MPALQRDLLAHLDAYLRVTEVPDYPHALNGLQVANSGRLDALAVAVDACQATITQAADAGAGLLIVHHGLFWGGLEPLVGRHGRRVRTLVARDLALYGAHLPLDCHPEVGNNHVLARQLGLEGIEPFGSFEGIRIGVAGSIDLTVAALEARLFELLGVVPRVIAHGPDKVGRVAIVSGAASELIREAVRAGIDTFVTGEGPHHSYFDAEEWGINLFYAGHYATETIGVRALGDHLAAKFGLSCTFIDHPTGL